MCFPLFHWQSQAFWNSHYKLKHPFLDASQTALCAHQDPGEKSCDPTRDWPRLTCECPGVSGRDMDWRWPPAVLAALSAAVHAQNLLKEVAINLHYLHYSLVSGQTAEREHSPSHQQKIGLKIYWAWPRPSEQDPVSPSVSLSHQESCISLLSSPSEGRQNENHNHRKLTKLFTWTTALSNSMKLWAMLCRATQGRRVMVEYSEKISSTGKGNSKQLHYSCL